MGAGAGATVTVDAGAIVSADTAATGSEDLAATAPRPLPPPPQGGRRRALSLRILRAIVFADIIVISASCILILSRCCWVAACVRSNVRAVWYDRFVIFNLSHSSSE